jgi:hypothetical protein
LNAQHFFYGGEYFETVRPPLVPLLLAPFIPFGVVGEYIYIALVSILFFYAIISLADYFFDQEDRKYIFYFFCLSGYALVYSFMSGSELLALSLFSLFALNLMKGQISGHYLALAFLTRYTFLPFVPFLLLSKNWKKIALNLLLFGLIVSPWLVYNYSVLGHPFASMIDSYTLNIKNRQYMTQPFSLIPVVELVGWFAPFFLLGVGVSLLHLLENPTITNRMKGTVFFLIVLALVLFQFSGIPYKQPRYLFVLILPVAFFASAGFHWLPAWRKYLHYPLLLSFLVTVGYHSFLMYENRTFDDRFYTAAQKVKELQLQDRQILTPYWVQMRYLAGVGNPIKEDIGAAIQKGKLVLIFKGKNYGTLDDKFFLDELNQYPTVTETSEYVILGKEDK